MNTKKRWNQRREALLRVACCNALRLGYLRGWGRGEPATGSG
ncbi:MAG: hypothetical protein QXQ87_04320 [Halobacteria archaeon]